MNQQGPKVSVIIPVYNTEKYLRECLDSVVNQTLRDIEIICVDDGSTDGSLDILREYEAMDSRVRVLTQPNINAGAARNVGLELAMGEYLSFLDSDDIFKPQMLEHALNQAEKVKADICVFRAEQLYQSTGVTHPMSGTLLMNRCPTTDDGVFSRHTNPVFIFSFTNPAPWNKLYRRSFIQSSGLSFQSVSYSNDTAFSFSALAMAERITVLDETLLTYRTQTADSITSRRDEAPLIIIDALLELKRRLTDQEVYEDVRDPFLQLALQTIIWSLHVFKTPLAFERLFYYTYSEGYVLFGLGEKDREFFKTYDCEGSYDKLMDIMAGSAIAYAKKYKMFGLSNNESFEEREIEKLRNSWSYRIGRAISWLLRKIRGGIRCYKQHGFRYTVRRVIAHLTGRA